MDPYKLNIPTPPPDDDGDEADIDNMSDHVADVPDVHNAYPSIIDGDPGD